VDCEQETDRIAEGRVGEVEQSVKSMDFGVNATTRLIQGVTFPGPALRNLNMVSECQSIRSPH